MGISETIQPRESPARRGNVQMTNLMSIYFYLNYLDEGRLVPLSKNKGKDQAELKDIRPIVVRSHVAKILEKAIVAKVAAAAPHLL